MLHGRVIRPPEAGAKLLRRTSPPALPGLVRSCAAAISSAWSRGEEAGDRRRGRAEGRMVEAGADVLGKLRELYRWLRTERRSEQDRIGRATWTRRSAARNASSRALRVPVPVACVDGPACAVADVREGGAVIWFGGRNPIHARGAADLEAAAEKVRVIWLPGPGSYGMNDADDCAADCAVLARRQPPGRVQYMRGDGTAWDPKGPPVSVRMRAGTSTEACLPGLRGCGFSGACATTAPTSARHARRQLIGGHKAKSTDCRSSRGVVRLHQRAQGKPHDRLGPLDAHRAAHRAPARPPTAWRPASPRNPSREVRCVRRRSGRVRLRYLHERDKASCRLRPRAAGNGAPRARAEDGDRGGTGHRLRAAQQRDGAIRCRCRSGPRDGPLSGAPLHLRTRLRLCREPEQPAGTIEANSSRG